MRRTIAVLMIASVPALAQRPAGLAAVATARAQWETTIGYIVKAADQVPEASYSYKPTPAVRSFGEIIGHVAGAQHLFCAPALGEAPGKEDDVEKTATTKAALVAALKASNDQCRRAYALSDAQATKMVKLFGADQTVLFALMENAVHDSEHYGNIVTYMRMLGMVPPSSQPSGR